MLFIQVYNYCNDPKQTHSTIVNEDSLSTKFIDDQRSYGIRVKVLDEPAISIMGIRHIILCNRFIYTISAGQVGGRCERFECIRSSTFISPAATLINF